MDINLEKTLRSDTFVNLSHLEVSPVFRLFQNLEAVLSPFRRREGHTTE